jgi:hypothetical protein
VLALRVEYGGVGAGLAKARDAMIGPTIEGFRTGQRVKIIGGSRLFTGKTGYIVRIAVEQSVSFFTVEILWRGKRQHVLCRASDLEAV